MLPVPDTLAAIYLVCFLVGLVFVLLSALASFGHGVLHLPGLHHDAHVEHFGSHEAPTLGDASLGGPAGHGAAQASSAQAAGGPAPLQGEHVPSASATAAHTSPSPINLMTIMAFLVWFGGAGYILHAIYRVFVPVSLAGAVLAGVAASGLVYVFFARVLLPGTTGAEADRDLVGRLAQVTIAIPGGGGVGEIVYTMSGSRHSDGARSADDEPIARGEEVVIVRFDRGIAYVQSYR